MTSPRPKHIEDLVNAFVGPAADARREATEAAFQHPARVAYRRALDTARDARDAAVDATYAACPIDCQGVRDCDACGPINARTSAAYDAACDAAHEALTAALADA